MSSPLLILVCVLCSPIPYIAIFTIFTKKNNINETRENEKRKETSADYLEYETE